MRARLALLAAEQTVELREIVLRDKPQAFLQASLSGSVPCLEQAEAEAIDESLDIMMWALSRRDPKGWLQMPSEADAMIIRNDGEFKTALDRYKYAVKYPEVDPLLERDSASVILREYNARLGFRPWLLGDEARLVDMAVLPFVRQFAHVDPEWFTVQPWPHLISWLDRFKGSNAFDASMRKYSPWSEGDVPVLFPQETGS